MGRPPPLMMVALPGALIAACSAGAPRPSPAERAAAPTYVASNIRRVDYAGSQGCRPCHAEIYDRWQRAPMRRMTRNADSADIKAPFDGRSFRLKEDTATLIERGGERFFQIASRFGDETYLVTRVIGGHHREDFAGVKVPSVGAHAPRGAVEKILPVSHVLATGELRYKGYSVLQPERPGLKAGPQWSRSCIFCHNTASLLSTSLGWMGGPPTQRLQGAVLDRLLPEEQRRWPTITDKPAMQAALADELSRLGLGAQPAQDDAPIKQALRALNDRVDGSHLIEVGIGCEACHNGSKEHADDPSKHPSFAPRSPFLSVPLDDRDPVAQTRACGRCHQVLFTGYPHTWEGGARNQNPGGSNINSGEARDMLLGGCKSRMTCSACHDVHAEDGGAARLALLQSPAGNALCTGCHGRYEGQKAVEAHTHHRGDGEGSVCVACHMPRKNMSLDTTLTRYHRIGSPTEARKVTQDRPLECALCHADKTVRSLVSTMQAWWGKSYDEPALVALYGSLDALPLIETLSRGKPHEQAAAIHVLGQRRDRSAAGPIAVHLTHRLPILRYYARAALEATLGASLPVDVHTDNATIAREASKWLAAYGIQGPAAAPTPAPHQPDDEGPDAR